MKPSAISRILPKGLRVVKIDGLLNREIEAPLSRIGSFGSDCCKQKEMNKSRGKQVTCKQMNIHQENNAATTYRNESQRLTAHIFRDLSSQSAQKVKSDNTPIEPDTSNKTQTKVTIEQVREIKHSMDPDNDRTEYKGEIEGFWQGRLRVTWVQLRGVGNSSNKANPIVFETMTGQKKGLAIVVVDLFHLKLLMEQVKFNGMDMVNGDRRWSAGTAGDQELKTLPRMPLRMGDIECLWELVGLEQDKDSTRIKEQKSRGYRIKRIKDYQKKRRRRRRSRAVEQDRGAENSGINNNNNNMKKINKKKDRKNNKKKEKNNKK
ncbi:hypothetical protein BY996DRAFT_6470324 [Phakopsora pachyrhizi]|nr:hypothetical protein BY996DRAFT_6470324 [Phakopsora pachyrhizi]